MLFIATLNTLRKFNKLILALKRFKNTALKNIFFIVLYSFSSKYFSQLLSVYHIAIYTTLYL